MEQYGVITVMKKSLGPQSFTHMAHEWFFLMVGFSTTGRPMEHKQQGLYARVLSG
jgi:hypothetical protein